ncbi:MAG: mucoidy inhibitor MuiA family protein [Jaaginema sp. PMC 1079.18]|nr:mucoidy inhibitor MuiA family protein [Jaaginema sp. PMC 1080.18]MEC4851444.1 mucoidy inhibitor MuiA family protein [Jaaginema sp. PMC 1079.18]MEC4868253.1 mucoidy inhibitor MuiA family protein [Jaaginema sp. PMC 1078.18]
MQVNLDTQIHAVTVYRDRALVKRRGRIQLTGSETELIIADLPLSLQSDSIRVKGMGNTPVRLLGVRTETVYQTEPVEGRIAEIVAEIENLTQQKQHLQNRISSVALQQNFVSSLKDKSVQYFARSLAQRETDLDTTESLLQFVGDRHLNYATEITQLQQDRQNLNKQISTLEKRLNQFQKPTQTQSYGIFVSVEAREAGEFILEASYVVNNASWLPLYDLQVNSQKQTIALDYLAEIKQNTGEDWLGVSLTLSTAKPGLGSLPPKLNPWFIDFPKPPPAPRFAPSAPIMTARQVTTESLEEDLMAFAASVDESMLPGGAAPQAAEIVTANVEKAGNIVTFQVNAGGDIPSDNNPHKVTLFRDEYPANLDYIAIPKLVSFAYLQAKMTNPQTGVTLLPGQANIFRDEEFVGKTSLQNIAPGQELTLNLGIDEGIQLERELIERQVDKKIIGGQRRITFAYKLTVTNLKDTAVNLILQEQLPVSRNEKLKVKLTQINPKIEPEKLGILKWNLTLNPQEKRHIGYQFVVEHPPEQNVIGLEI